MNKLTVSLVLLSSFAYWKATLTNLLSEKLIFITEKDTFKMRHKQNTTSLLRIKDENIVSEDLHRAAAINSNTLKFQHCETPYIHSLHSKGFKKECFYRNKSRGNKKEVKLEALSLFNNL